MSNTNMEQLVALVRAGELAVELWRAEEAAANARTAYHHRIQRYENTYNDGQRMKFNPADPADAEIVEYTRERYAAAQSARKRVYSVKQKLRRACVKVARLNAAACEVSHA